LVVEIFACCLEWIYKLSANKPGSGLLVTHINGHLEHLKQDVLKNKSDQDSVFETQSKDLPNSVQSMIQTHRLFSAYTGSVKSIYDILGVDASQTDKSRTIDKESLTSVAKLLSSATNKIGFIVIYKISRVPRKHDISAIINPSDLQDATAGINKQLIERTETIKPLLINSPTKDSLMIVNTMHSGGDEDYYYILQTLDGENFSVMTPWATITNVRNLKIWQVPAKFFTITVSKNKKEKKEKKEKTETDRILPSERLFMYNNNLETAILKSLVAPLIEPLSIKTEIARADAYWNSVRIRLSRPIVENYKKKIGNLKSITPNSVTVQLLNDGAIEQQVALITKVAMEDLSASLTAAGTETVRAIDILRNELAVSYLREYADMFRRYRQKLADIIDEKHQDLEKALKRGHDITFCMPVVESIVDEQLKIFINRRSGIFITIQNIVDVHSAAHA